MPVATRTIGPLHLEDLEPHRFEDLVRQLLYDFRAWRQLEATGRAGSDDSFDVRGWEKVSHEATGADEESVDGEEAPEPMPVGEDRLWLIQCKREKRIGPKKLVQYLDDIPEDELKQLYGIVFVAWCDFSKQARDVFRAKVLELGVSEAHLWGKAEVEDQLFQPKNDHLLFAYTGISLQTRRRSLKTEVRSKLATKRKASKLLNAYQPVLIRDASDDRFPYLDKDESLERFFDRGRWLVRPFDRLTSKGLVFIVRKYYAYIDDDGVRWDYSELANAALSHSHEDPWDGYERANEDRQAAWDMWRDFPDKNRAWYEMTKYIPYENVLAFDDIGDEAWPQGVQILTTPFDTLKGPFSQWGWHSLEGVDRHSGISASPDDENRIKKFPRKSKS